ncbi:NAD(P)-dependent alcohol dehydrogenase [Chloroflexota bacterium]
MKAIICEEFGSPPDVLKLNEIEKPVPKDNEVLVKVRGAAVNYSTTSFVTGNPFIIRLMGGGLSKPKFRIPGAEIAGQVEAVGRNVMQFQPGDEVFGDLSGCGRGGFAEYVSVPETFLALKPANITFEEAASVTEAAVVALQCLRDHGKIKSGHKVLINGASGGIGTFGVQIAKAFGAEVTGVCGPGNLEMVRSIGADHVIDYTKEDFSRSGQRYDLIVAVKGSNSVFDYKRALNPGGISVGSGGSSSQVFGMLLFGPVITMMGSKNICGMINHVNQKDLYVLKELIEVGKVKPVIDKRFQFNEVGEAMRYYAEGHSRGKVVITVGDSN